MGADPGKFGARMKHPLLQTYGPFDGWMILFWGGLSIGFFAYQVQKATV